MPSEVPANGGTLVAFTLRLIGPLLVRPFGRDSGHWWGESTPQPLSPPDPIGGHDR